jgi:hypothetical protein
MTDRFSSLICREIYGHLPVVVLFELSRRSVVIARKPGKLPVVRGENRGLDLFFAARSVLAAISG